MKRNTRRWFKSYLLVGSALFVSSLQFGAQAQTAGGLQYYAPRQVVNGTSMRLEGKVDDPAHLWMPGVLDVKAGGTVVFDFDLKAQLLKKVVASKDVSFDLKMAAKGTAPASHINATCDSATLGPATKNGTRDLTLAGNVNGYYEIGAARSTLRGNKAVITIGSGTQRTFDVALQGGPEGVRFEVPAQMFSSAPTSFDSFDTIVITGSDAVLDQAAGTMRIAGKARAEGKDKDGKPSGKFLVTATDFLVARDANGKMNTLQTVGRTKMKVDLPPSVTPTETSAAVAVPATGAAPTTGVAPVTSATPSAGTAQGATTSSGPGTPTSLEADADKATVTFSDSKLVLEGNVKGQYELRSEDGTANRYNFGGDKVIIRSLPKAEGSTSGGPSLEAFHVTAELPNIGLGF